MQEILSFIKYLATSNTINFIIMLTILCWIIKKININKIFESGIQSIETTIQKSDEEKNNSLKHLQKAQKLIDGLPTDIRVLEKNCNDKIDVFKNQIEDTTKKAIANINDNISKVISIDEKKISNLLTENTAQESINQAELNIINLLNSKPELHDKFIQNSIDELDKVKL